MEGHQRQPRQGICDVLRVLSTAPVGLGCLCSPSPQPPALAAWLRLQHVVDHSPPKAPQQGWAARPVTQRLAAEAGAAALAAAATSLLPRVPQPASSHHFAGDSRHLLGVPHVRNVLSNVAIAAPGAAGLGQLLGARKRPAGDTAAMPAAERVCWVANFLGMMLGKQGAGILRGTLYDHVYDQSTPLLSHTPSPNLQPAGSARYHLNPEHATLAWDRLGMCCTFASLLAAVIAERRRAAAGVLALPLLLMAACGSVLWWQASEAAGRGDLRWYALM